jgi:hypothetical protein
VVPSQLVPTASQVMMKVFQVQMMALLLFVVDRSDVSLFLPGTFLG